MTGRDENGIRIRVPARLKEAGSGAPAAADEDVSPLDALDRQLMAHLMENGRLGNRTLAGMVGVSEVTVGSRLRRLVANNVLVFTALVDWEAAGYDWFVISRISVQRRDPRDVATELGRLPGCIACSVVFGRSDVLAYFLVENRAGLRRLLDEEIGGVDGIAHIDTDLALTTSVTVLGQATFLNQGIGDFLLPEPVVSMDALDVSIVELLVDDGRQSSRRIGRTLSVAEGTVRARVARLLDAGLLKIIAMVNPLAVGMAGLVADLTVHVRRDMLDDVAGKLAAVGQVVVIATTIGSGDIVVVLAVADHAQLVDIVQNSVRNLDGVLDVDVLEMTDVIRLNPFLKRFDA